LKKNFFEGVSEFSELYNGFIIDLWGVLHDGREPYPAAIETLAKLKKQGKQILLLSNAPRRAKRAEEKLTEMGFLRKSYDHILTSGEATFEYFLSSSEYGERYYHMGPEKDAELIEEIARYKRVNKPEEADFVLTTGFDYDESILDEKLPDIKECLKYNLPLICTNPDKIIVRQTGEKMLCAGVIAEEYEKSGGKVRSFGKPYDYVYKRALELLKTEKNKTIVIGDNLHTDIKGAKDNSIDSVLVIGGILAAQFGKTIQKADLMELYDKEKIIPSGSLTLFKWS